MGAARIGFGPVQTAENDKGVRMKRYRDFGSWVTGLVATILAVVPPVQAANDFSSNDEGPFVGGVFSRPIGNAVPLPQTDVDDDLWGVSWTSARCGSTTSRRLGLYDFT